ncbi:amidohydrolase family protein [Candidatus Daviesbacteria bacterium]|nr:amidohydrolase family protein [Candidatus Daviesbacteria bacterium]
MPKILTLPGLIDVHTHLREPGATQKEDFESGTKAAIAGGYTAILDMPNNPIPTISEEALKQKIKLATGRIYSDLGFHFGATPANYPVFEKIKDKVFGLKVYMNYTTGDLLMEDMNALEEVFSKWPKGKVIMVHAEGETLKKAVNLAKKYHQRLHVCHISLKKEIEAVKQAKKEGLDISCEVSCHHLFLNSDDVKRLGPFGCMRPPLSSKEDQQALWDNLDYIDMIASDHAPHTRQEKETPGKIVNGVPGLETSLPILLTAVAEGKLTIDRLIQLTNKNPRRIFKIPEQADTEIEVDLNEQYTINHKQLFTKCKWTPFEGMEVQGKVKKVVLRGKTVFDQGRVIGPYGQVIFPEMV